MSLIPVAADHPGSLAAELTTIDGREVVLVEIADETRRGAICEADGHTFAAAIDHALHAGLPLLGILSSSGSDVNAGVAALHGWGTAARDMGRCSGRIPGVQCGTGTVLAAWTSIVWGKSG